jgi:hypothetical protein
MIGKDLIQYPAARRKAAKQIGESKLVFTTCIGSAFGLIRREEFNPVIVDETSQTIGSRVLGTIDQKVPAGNSGWRSFTASCHRQSACSGLRLRCVVDGTLMDYERIMSQEQERKPAQCSCNAPTRKTMARDRMPTRVKRSCTRTY